MNKIENDHQLQITEKWLKSHIDSLEALKKEKGSMNRLLYELHRDATKSMIEDLQEQIKIYKETPSSKITFEDLIQYGREHGANIVNRMPWSFTYKGMSITHENDNEYLILTPKGIIKFNSNCVLFINGDSVYVKSK